jgi:hypothetical protein
MSVVNQPIEDAISQCGIADPCQRETGSCEVRTPNFIGVAVKWAYRVRLNGEDHQWGKDPLKEVVG